MEGGLKWDTTATTDTVITNLHGMGPKKKERVEDTRRFKLRGEYFEGAQGLKNFSPRTSSTYMRLFVSTVRGLFKFLLA